jgi:hypothetical protein
MMKDIKDRWTQLIAEIGRSGKSQQCIAIESGTSQSAVSRILAACPERDGAAFKRLCIYANKSLSMGDEKRLVAPPIKDKILAAAIHEVWNGTPEHALALAAMIRAAGNLARASLL